MIANDPRKKQIHAQARASSYLVCLIPARQGAKPLLDLRSKLPWNPFINALPPLIPISNCASLPSRQELQAAREALRGGFTLSRVFSEDSLTWIDISPMEKIALALNALGSAGQDRSETGHERPVLIPARPALYLGPGTLPVGTGSLGELSLGSWRLCVYALRFLAKDPRLAFSFEVLYERSVFKTMPRTASHVGPENL